jgi:hypothetical protein
VGGCWLDLALAQLLYRMIAATQSGHAVIAGCIGPSPPHQSASFDVPKKDIGAAYVQL